MNFNGFSKPFQNGIIEKPVKIDELTRLKYLIEHFIYSEYKMAVMAKNGVIMDDLNTAANVISVTNWIFESGNRPWLRISGFIGNGKSTMLEALKKWFDKTHGRFRFPKYTAAEIIKIAASEDKREFETICNFPVLMIDDLGTEPNEIVVFGNKTQPMRDLFYFRYDKRLITVFTTNLTDSEFSQYYGERIADRCRELQTKIVFKQKSYRK